MEEKREQIFQLIELLSHIELREDPAEYGLSDLNQKLADASNKRSKASILANKIIKKTGDKNRQLCTIKSLYQIKLNRLLSTDKYVSAGESKDERFARAKTPLKNEEDLTRKLELEVSEWNDLNKCIDNCLSTLKTAKEILSRQLSVIMQQITLGEIDASSFGTK